MSSQAQVLDFPATRSDGLPTVRQMRFALRRGGYPEHELSDDDVRDLRDRMRALAEIGLQVAESG